MYPLELNQDSGEILRIPSIVAILIKTIILLYCRIFNDISVHKKTSFEYILGKMMTLLRGKQTVSNQTLLLSLMSCANVIST